MVYLLAAVGAFVVVTLGTSVAADIAVRDEGFADAASKYLHAFVGEGIFDLVLPFLPFGSVALASAAEAKEAGQSRGRLMFALLSAILFALYAAIHYDVQVALQHGEDGEAGWALITLEAMPVFATPLVLGLAIWVHVILARFGR